MPRPFADEQWRITQEFQNLGRISLWNWRTRWRWVTFSASTKPAASARCIAASSCVGKYPRQELGHFAAKAGTRLSGLFFLKLPFKRLKACIVSKQVLNCVFQRLRERRPFGLLPRIRDNFTKSLLLQPIKPDFDNTPGGNLRQVCICDERARHLTVILAVQSKQHRMVRLKVILNGQ